MQVNPNRTDRERKPGLDTARPHGGGRDVGDQADAAA